jgi:hypothetical protein
MRCLRAGKDSETARPARDEGDGLDMNPAIRNLDELVESGAMPIHNHLPERVVASCRHESLATLSLKQICDLPVSELADEYAHLHLCVTSPPLADGLAVIRAGNHCAERSNDVLIGRPPSSHSVG